MRFVRTAVALALLGLAAAARAQQAEHHHPSAVGTVLRDTVAGGLLGSAVAGGVILYNMGFEGNNDYDWGRTLAWGAAIGTGAGLLLGLVEAASRGYGAISPGPVRDGMSTSLDLRARDQSRMVVLPVMSRGFW